MALTTELLNANAALSGLTDEQKTAIVEMSKNDETAVIGQKTGEIYGGLDADILAASGIAKNGTEKTYDYAKRVIGEIKGQAGNALAIKAGNDLIMPGGSYHKKELLKGIKEGICSEEDLRRCCANVVKSIFNSATQREYIG